jgi:hypothetical protein
MFNSSALYNVRHTQTSSHLLMNHQSVYEVNNVSNHYDILELFDDTSL